MEIVLNAPSQGIAQSPLLGNSDVRNLDIYTVPGVCRINNSLTPRSAGVITGLINWYVRSTTTPANIYALDNAGVVYISTDTGATWAVLAGNTQTNAHGNGLTIWKDYLVVARDTAIDLYGPLSSSPAWRNAWAGLTLDSDVLWHPMWVSKIGTNGPLYIGAGRYLAMVVEASGQTFTWNSAATYLGTTARAFSGGLPPNYRIKCLTELGNNLYMGTWQGTTITDFKIADIFPWDRSSTTYGQPIFLTENGANAMLSENNLLYILAGCEGKIYKSDGVSVVQIGQIPNNVANIEGGNYLDFFPGAFISYKGRPTFGVSSGGATYTGGMGIYSLSQTNKGTILSLEHTVSPADDGTLAVLKVGALLGVSRDSLIASWQAATDYGCDKTLTTNRATGYIAYWDSPFYQVGTNLQLYKMKELEVTFTKELAANEGIQISYRVNLTDSFTALRTWTYADLGAVISYNDITISEDDIPPSEFLQIRVALTGTNSTPELRRAVLR